MSGPYAVEREVEDVAALLEVAGRPRRPVRHLERRRAALEAAGPCKGVRQVVCFEPPFVVDDTKPALAGGFVDRLDAHVAAGRLGARSASSSARSGCRAR